MKRETRELDFKEALKLSVNLETLFASTLSQDTKIEIAEYFYSRKIITDVAYGHLINFIEENDFKSKYQTE